MLMSPRRTFQSCGSSVIPQRIIKSLKPSIRELRPSTSSVKRVKARQPCPVFSSRLRQRPESALSAAIAKTRTGATATSSRELTSRSKHRFAFPVTQSRFSFDFNVRSPNATICCGNRLVIMEVAVVALKERNSVCYENYSIAQIAAQSRFCIFFKKWGLKMRKDALDHLKNRCKVFFHGGNRFHHSHRWSAFPLMDTGHLHLRVNDLATLFGF